MDTFFVCFECERRGECECECCTIWDPVLKHYHLSPSALTIVERLEFIGCIQVFVSLSHYMSFFHSVHITVLWRIYSCSHFHFQQETGEHSTQKLQPHALTSCLRDLALVSLFGKASQTWAKLLILPPLVCICFSCPRNEEFHYSSCLGSTYQCPIFHSHDAASQQI